MDVPCTITVADVRLDGSTQPRESVNWEVVSEYAQAMAEGAAFPPIIVYSQGWDYWLADGFHRVHALRQLGRTECLADVRPGLLRDAILAAMGANITHGFRRSNADKRRAVLTLLRDEEWSAWSDREIARRCGVANSFVSSLRGECIPRTSVLGEHLALQTTALVLAGPSPVVDAVDGAPSLYHLPAEPPPSLMSSASHEWYTPVEYLDAVRAVLGDIDLDPASSTLANERVGARRYFTRADDGLTHDWPGRVFLNPPYGRDDGADSNQERWSHRLIDQYRRGITSAAVLLVNATPSNKWWAPLWDFPICFTERRVRFWGPDGEQSSPTHSNAFVYLGADVDAFDRVFSRFGVVAVRRTRWIPA